jgi:hypothetical protein
VLSMGSVMNTLKNAGTALASCRHENHEQGHGHDDCRHQTQGEPNTRLTPFGQSLPRDDPFMVFSPLVWFTGSIGGLIYGARVNRLAHPFRARLLVAHLKQHRHEVLGSGKG